MSGTTAFPTGLDTFPAISSSTQMDGAGVEHDVVHENVFAALAALETKVGVNSSAVTTSLDYLVKYVKDRISSSKRDDFTAATGDQYFSLPMVGSPSALTVFKNGALLPSAAYTLTGNSGQMYVPFSSGDAVTFVYHAKVDGFSGNATLAAALVNDPLFAYVKALFHFNGTNGSTTITDQAGGTVTVNGAAALTTATKILGSAALSVDMDSVAVCGVDVPLGANLGSSDWTLECFINLSSPVLNKDIVRLVGSTGVAALTLTSENFGRVRFSLDGATSAFGTFELGDLRSAWNYICVQRTGTQFHVFVNGVLKMRQTSSSSFVQTSTALKIGVTGGGAGGTTAKAIFDETRMTLGVARYPIDFTPPASAYLYTSIDDPFFSSVSSLHHFDGTNGGTTFTDETGKSWTAVNATTSTAQSKFGGSSGVFNGTNAAISVTSGTAFTMTGDFTVEFWIRPTAFTNNYGCVLANGSGTWTAGNRFIMMYGSGTGGTANKIGFGGNGVTSTVTSSTALAINTWYHVVVVRKGTVLAVYVDGVLEASGIEAATVDFGQSGTTYIGRNAWDGANGYLAAYIDEMRITKGIARIPAGIPAPIVEFQNS